MNWLAKLRAAAARFMIGRSGTDALSLALLYTAIALNLLALLPGAALLSPLALIPLILSLVRALSKNRAKRAAENARYLALRAKATREAKQAWSRLKNARRYRYFRCPECRARLRLKRGAGEGTVTCGQCGHAFKARA